MSAGVLGGFTQGIFKMEKTSLGVASAEDIDEVCAPERLRHEFQALTGLRIAGEGGFHQRRRVELGLHGFSQKFDGLPDAAQAGFFFFDAADEAVEVFARGFGEGVEESYETVSAESAGEKCVEGHQKNLTTDHN